MTTGKNETDGRVRKNDSFGYAHLVGPYASKVWNGSDGRSQENPYSMTELLSLDPMAGYYQPDNSIKYYGTIQDMYGGVAWLGFSSSDRSYLRNRALKGVLGKYKQHDFNLAVFLGELPESVSMIAEPVIATLRSYRLARRGKFSKAKRVLEDYLGRRVRIDHKSASSWLALRYGWLPMISDAFAACEAYQALVTSEPVKYLRVRSKAKMAAGLSPAYYVKWASFRNELSCSVILKTAHRQSAPASLGLLNPAVLAWELLPLSFVVDWAADVGSYLELITTLPSNDGSKYITTYFMRRRCAGPIVYTLVPNRRHVGDAGTVRSVVTVERSVSDAPGVAWQGFRNPFKPTLNRMGDALALARALSK